MSGAPSPAHVIVVTKAEVASLAHRVTALQAVQEWARSKGIPCVAVCPTQAARAAATGSTVAGIPQVRIRVAVCVYKCVAVCGCVWLCMAVYGCVWLCD